MFELSGGHSVPAVDVATGPAESPRTQTRTTKGPAPGLRARVSSIGLYAPPRVESAAELAPRIGTSEEWIITRTGVRQRRISEEPVEVMAANAARAALSPGEVPDLILNASVTPRQLIPDTSVFVQQELGLEGIPSRPSSCWTNTEVSGMSCRRVAEA